MLPEVEKSPTDLVLGDAVAQQLEIALLGVLGVLDLLFQLGDVLAKQFQLRGCRVRPTERERGVSHEVDGDAPGRPGRRVGVRGVERSVRGVDEDVAELVEAERAGDPAPAISRAGVANECEVCASALALWARLYGEEAGNLALKLMATGGVWVGGGIAPKILPVLDGGAFLDGFFAKGRMRPLMESMPMNS